MIAHKVSRPSRLGILSGPRPNSATASPRLTVSAKPLVSYRASRTGIVDWISKRTQLAPPPRHTDPDPRPRERISKRTHLAHRRFVLPRQPLRLSQHQLRLQNR